MFAFNTKISYLLTWSRTFRSSSHTFPFSEQKREWTSFQGQEQVAMKSMGRDKRYVIITERGHRTEGSRAWRTTDVRLEWWQRCNLTRVEKDARHRCHFSTHPSRILSSHSNYLIVFFSRANLHQPCYTSWGKPESWYGCVKWNIITFTGILFLSRNQRNFVFSAII